MYYNLNNQKEDREGRGERRKKEVRLYSLEGGCLVSLIF